MIPTHLRTVTALAAASMLLAGCTTSPDPAATTPTASASASVTAGPSASPTTTLSAAEQEAFEQATAVVMAYRQTIADLQTGARARINDLDNYVTGDKLDRERRNVQQLLAQGGGAEPRGAQLVLVSAEPVLVRLKADPPTVVLWACINGSAFTGIDSDGNRSPGKTERLQYTVVKTTYLPTPGWAVSEAKGARDPEGRTC